MHPALLANTAWLDEELATLHHLVVGLIDESAQVVQVLPQGRAEGEVVAFGTRLSWRETRHRWLNRRAVRKLAEPLRAEEVDLLHALDGRLWRAALDLGALLGVPVILSANSGFDAVVAARCRDKLTPGSVLITCATRPLTELINQTINQAVPVHHVPPGVHLGQTTAHGDDETPCVVVSGSGGCDEHMLAMLEGARLAIQAHPTLQMFFDAQRQDPHKLWRAISRLGLLANSTLIPRRLGHREVLLRADALVHPQPLGRARTLTLRAMAHAVPVLATVDPLLDYLIDGVTAHVLTEPSPEAWAGALSRIAADLPAGRSLGLSARQWIGEHRLASDQLASMLGHYRELVGEPIAFPG